MDRKAYRLLKELPILKNNQRYIIGVDGLSRSGKTSFVTQLEQCLYKVPVITFHLDDYIVEKKNRYYTEYDEWYEYYYLQWDVETLRMQLFEKLKSEDDLHLPAYHADLDTLICQSVKIPESCYIIIEGVFLQRREWKGFYDYLVYIDCPRDKRFNRETAATRKNMQKFINRYWKAEDHYLQSINPIQHADMIIQG
ncbi:kinase [Sediminibacillus massiliensis]|uniref:kinase n=1 Tax=Sediminibacillus massiliensis TaxID=1926277 RepID=UPI000988770E|nr:kinase [Sediminibacillus massiliensis]